MVKRSARLFWAKSLRWISEGMEFIQPIMEVAANKLEKKSGAKAKKKFNKIARKYTGTEEDE